MWGAEANAHTHSSASKLAVFDHLLRCGRVGRCAVGRGSRAWRGALGRLALDLILIHGGALVVRGIRNRLALAAAAVALLLVLLVPLALLVLGSSLPILIPVKYAAMTFLHSLHQIQFKHSTVKCC